MKVIKVLIFFYKPQAPENKTTKGVRDEILDFLGSLPVYTYRMQLVTLFDNC